VQVNEHLASRTGYRAPPIILVKYQPGKGPELSQGGAPGLQGAPPVHPAAVGMTLPSAVRSLLVPSPTMLPMPPFVHVVPAVLQGDVAPLSGAAVPSERAPRPARCPRAAGPDVMRPAGKPHVVRAADETATRAVTCCAGDPAAGARLTASTMLPAAAIRRAAVRCRRQVMKPATVRPMVRVGSMGPIRRLFPCEPIQHATSALSQGAGPMCQ
jgi:hypothetical protein